MLKLVTDLDKNYICSECRNRFSWNDNSRWYGSIRQLDRSEDIVVVCSEECKIEFDKKLKTQKQQKKNGKGNKNA